MSGLIAHFLFAANSRRKPPKTAVKGGEQGSRGDFARWAKETMAVKLDEIRSAAARVAASHGLDVVDMEFIGPAKERTLRIYLEKNAEGRAQLKAAIAAKGAGGASRSGWLKAG